MNYIEEYYKQIKDGQLIVSKKVEKVYKHLVEEIHNNKSEYYFEPKRAQHVIDFIQIYCRHSKGKVGGKPFLLELWQLALVSATFGFVHKETKLRKYKELILIVARKNGKSALASALALYMLFADGESGPEIYSVATKKDQAKIIWNESKKMIKKSPVLRKRCKCLVAEINSFANEGTFRPLSSDSNSLDGLNVSASFIDELHAIKEKNLYDVIIDGMTARSQPLSVITSTAGTVREGIFDLKYEQCEQIINGYEDKIYVNERVLPIIYELDSRNEWTDERCWMKANPGLETIKSKSQLKEKVKDAQHDSRNVKNLLCKDFNIRETSTETFLNFEQLNNTATFNINELNPRPKYCIAGVDLSQTTDLTAASILFKLSSTDPMIYVKTMYWLPEDLLENRVREDKIPYDIWKQQGLLRTTPGNKVDYHFVVNWFKEIQEKYGIYIFYCGYDSWSAQYFVKEMEDNFGKNTMIPVIQGKKTLSSPMKSIAADLEKKIINYNNNQITKWCMTNVAIDIDKNENIQPAKYNQRKRIDGFASMLDAYTVYQNNIEAYHSMI